MTGVTCDNRYPMPFDELPKHNLHELKQKQKKDESFRILQRVLLSWGLDWVYLISPSDIYNVERLEKTFDIVDCVHP